MKRAVLLCCLLSGSGFCAEVRLPSYTREVLPNGVVVYLMPKPGVPLVHFRILARGGMESEPPGLAGISSVAAHLLRKGTPSRTAAQFSDELDSLGGTFHANSDEQVSFVESEFLKKDLAAGLDLTADAVLHASLPETEVEKMLAQETDAVKSSKDNPQAALREYFAAFFYGPQHPYGRPENEASVHNLNRANIADYVKRTYAGKNLVVIATGDFDPSSAVPLITKLFSAAPTGDAYRWAKATPPAPGGRLLLIDKPGATQTYFRIARPGISRSDPDRTTLLLLNTLFGGRFTSMLNDELRVNSGLTYGAGSTLDLHRERGALYISTYTRTETTSKAIDLALEVLKRVNDKGVQPDQLASVKAYVKGTYPTHTLETAAQLSNVLGDIEIFDLNRGEVDDLFSRIDSVTLDQINAAAKKWYRPDNLTFVVLGNASQIRESVRKYAPRITEVSIKDPGFDD